MVELDIDHRAPVERIEVPHAQHVALPLYQFHRGCANRVGPRGRSGGEDPHHWVVLAPRGMDFGGISLVIIDTMCPVEHEDVGETLDPVKAVSIRFIDDDLGDAALPSLCPSEDRLVELQVLTLQLQRGFSIAALHDTNWCDHVLLLQDLLPFE